MTSSFPGALDTLTTNKQDDIDAKSGTDLGLTTTTGDHAQHHNDLADAINKIEAELGTNPSLASSTVAVLNTALLNRWTTIFGAHVNLSAAAAGTYIGHHDITEDVTGGFAIITHRIDPADYAITGFTMQCRVVMSVLQNAVNNSATTVLTGGLYPVTPAGSTTTFAPTFGTVVSGSTAATSGQVTASTDTRIISSTFTAPTADSYALGVALSVATGAGATKCSLRLEYRYT